MCGVESVKSEVKGEEELRVLQTHEFRVLKKPERDAGKKGSVESGGDCCEPLCGPLTCGP